MTIQHLGDGIARQYLTSALRPAVGAVPAQEQIMYAIEDLIRAYLVDHIERTHQITPLIVNGFPQ